MKKLFVLAALLIATNAIAADDNKQSCTQEVISTYFYAHSIACRGNKHACEQISREAFALLTAECKTEQDKPKKIDERCNRTDCL